MLNHSLPTFTRSFSLSSHPSGSRIFRMRLQREMVPRIRTWLPRSRPILHGLRVLLCFPRFTLTAQCVRTVLVELPRPYASPCQYQARLWERSRSKRRQPTPGEGDLPKLRLLEASQTVLCQGRQLNVL